MQTHLISCLLCLYISLFLGADVPQEETPRSEIRDGERERFIVVEETAISKAFGAGKILRDSRGRKSIAIRAEDDEVQTHGELLNSFNIRRVCSFSCNHG